VCVCVCDTTIDVESWLQKEGVDAITTRLIKENAITLSSMKDLTDEALMQMGIPDSNTRLQVLQAIKKNGIPLQTFSEREDSDILKRKRGDEQSTTISPIQLGPPETSPSLSANSGLAPALALSASVPVEMQIHGERKEEYPIKKLKLKQTKKPKIKLKDIDVLINDQRMPVNIGTHVYCGTVASNSGTTGVGTVVQYKDKAVIEYRVNNELRRGSIAKFYKDVTGDPLQEKGPSWGNIFFKDTVTGQVNSLEGLKYILNGPKKPVSAFLYFSNEARMKHKDLKPDIFARLAGELWKKLSPEEKMPYRVLEQQDKERFFKEKTDWEARQMEISAKYTTQSVELNSSSNARYPRQDDQTVNNHDSTAGMSVDEHGIVHRLDTLSSHLQLQPAHTQ
jgi:hypothetical protein